MESRPGSLAIAFSVLFALASLAADGARAQIAVPFSQSNQSLGSTGTTISYTVDLATLPERPQMTAQVVPDVSHPDMQLQVEISGCTLVNPFGSCPATSLSPPGTGPRSVAYEPWRCIVGQTYPAYVGKTCNVKVRALDFGSAGPPASFDLSVRAVSVVPTSTLSASITTTPIQTVALSPTRDTTIYRAATSASNGLGQTLWAAPGTAALRTLIAFDPTASIPAGSTIVQASLELMPISPTQNGATVDLFALAPTPSVAWAEGTADAAGDESTPPTAVGGAATWSHRVWSPTLPTGAWTTAGGDLSGSPLARVSIDPAKLLVIDPPALTDHVQAALDLGSATEGLAIVPVEGAAHFASDENPTKSIRPRLVVAYQLPPPSASGNLSTSTASFVNEGQNFRWIYDLDHDDVLITPVAGRCEVANNGSNLLPYTYQFQGNPSYAGLDCCTWQIDSSTGIVGSGQALFFINVDASNPANQPADSDLDGIKNLCDNCPGIPNGPLLGSCTSGTKIGKLCRSNQDCPGGGCSLAQDDLNLDGTGNACVPEPGFGAGLLAGLAGLSGLSGLARRRPGGSDWTRRRFLGESLRRSGALGAGIVLGPTSLALAEAGLADSSLGAAGLGGAEAPAAGPPRIRRRRPLGKTGLEIPDISMGSFSLEHDDALVAHALDRGITHFDTAESYAEGRAEEVLGRALVGHRARVTLTSKFSAGPEVSAAAQMAVLERSLRRLRTDYVDVYLNHAVNDVACLDSPEWQTFVERAKRQGKIRAAGMSGHAGRLAECLRHGLDAGLLDVILVAYNYAQQPSYRERVQSTLSGLSSAFDFVAPQPELPALLARARAAGVGVMVMKTLRGARLNDMRPFETGGRTFAQAAFRWVLSDPSVDGLVVSMTSREQIDEYVAASGSGAPDADDLALLARYETRHAATTCSIGCGDCADACPTGVPIADVMRMRMYAADYGIAGTAAREYARLAIDARACLACSGLPCAGACSSGLSIVDWNRDAHRRLVDAPAIRQNAGTGPTHARPEGAA